MYLSKRLINLSKQTSEEKERKNNTLPTKKDEQLNPERTKLVLFNHRRF